MPNANRLRLKPPDSSGSSPGVPCPKIGLRVIEAASLMGATPGYVERMMREGKLAYRIVGDERVVAPEDLKAHFESLPKQTGPSRVRDTAAATAARRAA